MHFSSKVITCQLSCCIIVRAVWCSKHNQSLGSVGAVSPDGLRPHCQCGGAGWDVGIPSFHEAGVFYLHGNLSHCKLIFWLYFSVDPLSCNFRIILTAAGKEIHEANTN